MKKDAVVKIDKKLEKEIISLIEKNPFLYASKKQIVNLAILEFLNSHKFNNNRKMKKYARIKEIPKGKNKIKLIR